MNKGPHGAGMTLPRLDPSPDLMGFVLSPEPHLKPGGIRWQPLG